MSGSRPEVSSETLKSISTPDKVESRLGTLEFDDGAPSEATAALLYDHLDFIHGVQAFIGALPGASVVAVRRGFRSVGVEDNSFTLFSELMDSASVFLTANCDTVYFWGFVDLSDGPMVIDVPPLGAPSGLLGTIDDMWFRWVTDLGLPGPDRGAGGRYLIVGPGYDGPLPDSGFHVFHARTTRVTVIGRGFMVDNDPTIPVEAIRNGFRISPYAPGTQGTAVASVPGRERAVGAATPVPETRFVEASGLAFNTIYPERLRVLGDGRRAGAGRTATGSGRSGATRSARLGRDRPRQAVQARRPNAQDPRRRRRRRQRNRPHRHVRVHDPRKASPTTPDSDVVQRALPRRLPVPRPAARDHRRRRGRRARATVHASSIPAPISSTWRPASRPRCACASPAWVRST